MSGKNFSPKTKRLFAAVNLPQGVREKLYENFLETPIKGFSFVKKENLHITLCFLGNCSKKQEKEAASALEELEGQPFEVELSGLSHFNKRVLFINAVKGKEELESIGRFLSGRLSFGSKNFHPHLTIARNKKVSSKGFQKETERLEKKVFREKFFVKSVYLMESVLSPKGPLYKKVFEKRL